MKRLTIKEILDNYTKHIHQDICIQGWVRAFRSNRFIALSDGSTANNIQIVVDFEKFDEVAEAFKMKGEFPLVKVADYLKHATVKELDAKDFTIPEVVASIKEDMELMLADAKKIREVANEEDDFSVANMMEDHIAYFVKQLWFIQAMSK